MVRTAIHWPLRGHAQFTLVVSIGKISFFKKKCVHYVAHLAALLRSLSIYDSIRHNLKLKRYHSLSIRCINPVANSSKFAAYAVLI